jgi:ribosomal protein S18 acetylase RimI-like enzyme
MNIAIREMTISDYEEVKALWQYSNGIELSNADTKESITRFLERNPGLSFVAHDGDQLVGAVLCGHDGRRGYIDHLAVKESHRCQGIGRALVGRCLYNLVQIGIRKWHLFVMQDNQEAIEFWKKLGWAQRVELVTMSKYNST